MPPKQNSQKLAFIIHETIIWALASLFLASTGSPIMIVVNVLRFAANIAIAYYQNAAGGAKASRITPYFAQLGVASFNGVMSVLEILGVVTGTAAPAEAIYRAKLYAFNSCMYLSAGIHDTKWGDRVDRSGFLPRMLLNPCFWMGPATFVSFTFAFSPIAPIWGNIGQTHFSVLNAVLLIISVAISFQGIWQSYHLRQAFVARNFGFIVPTILFALALPLLLTYQQASWQFNVYAALMLVGNLAYLWRNRKAPDYIKKLQVEKLLAKEKRSLEMAV